MVINMAGTLVIGFVFVDIKGFSAGTYHARGRNVGDIRFIHGGVSRNVAENIAGCGMPVSFVSLYEDTALGNDVLRRLNRVGVDTAHMKKVDRFGIGTWMVILDERGDVAGEISCPPDTAALEALIDAHGEELIRDCDNVILEIDTSVSIDERVLAWAEQYQKPVFTVVGNLSVIQSHPEFLSSLTCFVCNETEAGKLFQKDLSVATPKEMLSVLEEHIGTLGCRSMVVTMGAQGAVYYEQKTHSGGIVPAIPTDVVDSTGAGDAFLSGTVMGLTRGMPLSRAVQVGTHLASAAIRTEESCAAPNPDFWKQFDLYYNYIT
ncbi:MAG: sugar kinase [Clostridia bacterium]|nr:sugar kinase [Clostridia bacterium]